MKINMQVLNFGYGTMESTNWAKVEILDGSVEHVDDGSRFFKGSKTAKLNFKCDDNFFLAKSFSKENFPSSFDLDVDMSIVGGKTQLKIVGFTSNNSGK